MRRPAVLLDTGPLVAYLNRNDHHHAWAVEQFRQIRAPLLTCEAVLSEATFLVAASAGGREQVLACVERGLVALGFRLEEELRQVQAFVGRYQADLADACLVRMSERHPGAVVLTLDTDFRDVYRRNGRLAIPALLPPGVGRRRGRRER